MTKTINIKGVINKKYGNTLVLLLTLITGFVEVMKLTGKEDQFDKNSKIYKKQQNKTFKKKMRWYYLLVRLRCMELQREEE